MSGLIIRVDASHELGLAHAARCSRLAAALPHDLNITIVGKGQSLKSFFDNSTIIEPGSDPGQAVIDMALQTGAKAVLIDEPKTDPSLWTALETQPSLKRILIDDFGSKCAADLVINGTVITHYHHYENLRAGAKSLCGPDYALIAPEFAAQRHESPRNGPILAVCGGGDRACQWAKQLAHYGPQLSKNHGFKLVVGASYPDLDELRAIANKSGAKLNSGLSVLDLAHAFAHTPIAILTGGMIVYEALAAGVPALVFPQIDNLVEEIDWLSNRNALINLGYQNGEDMDYLHARFTDLHNNPNQMNSLMSMGPQLIDGQGIQRVSELILEFILKRNLKTSPAKHST